MRHLHIGWFGQHAYLLVFLATVIEGLGIPLPAEVLYVATAALVRVGAARLPLVIASAVAGNTVGSLIGFTVAYVGGQQLIGRVFRLIGVKEDALRKVEEFFGKYGPLTVFISRFVGVIRAATIYTAGAARMAPWKFAAYIALGALIWNWVWAWAAYQFGAALPGMIHRWLGRWAVWLVAVIAVLLLIRLVIAWNKRRNSP